MMLENLLSESFILIIIFSLVPLIICSVLSLLIALVQALTQIQEQSLSYVVKFVTLVALIWFGGNYFSNYIIRFIEESLKSLALMGQLS